ncbi:hypothetical protein Hamer_G007157 [Homarus americanus]|uniref:Uncharacterized protein n=1 Tax=Homarus americanus TaxID=6706 RepID=A0A8J5K0Y1_HOMAM|nr:hypothetical protein Hamer_G007157 [Homarus americanus]
MAERCVVLVDDRTNDQLTANGARQQLFTRKGREIANFPPTKSAFYPNPETTVNTIQLWYVLPGVEHVRWSAECHLANSSLLVPCQHARGNK